MVRKNTFFKKNWDIIINYILTIVIFISMMFGDFFLALGMLFLSVYIIFPITISIVIIKSINKKSYYRILWIIPQITFFIFMLLQIIGSGSAF